MRQTALAVAALLLFAAAGAMAHVKNIEPGDEAVVVVTDGARIEITPITDEIIRVATLSMDSHEKFEPSKSVVLKPGNVDFRVNSSPNSVEVVTDSTTVKVDRKTGLLSFLDARGQELISEASVPSNLQEERFFTFTGKGGDHFYGAGERGHSFLLNGDTLVMYNRQNYGYTAGDPRINQMNITVPYFVSDKGYGILFDDFGKGKLILGDTIEYESASHKPVSYYFINGGGNLAGATSNYTLLTGRQGLPPFWALGYITSKYGYHTQDEAVGVVDTLKNHGYPLDGMVLDLYWYGKETDMGRLEWNKEQWQDHAKMLRDLLDKGVNMVLISQPYINKIGALDNYNMLSEAGMLVKDDKGNTHDVTTWVGDAGMFDVGNPDTRRWLWNRLKGLTAEGVQGWWGDLGEPEVHPATIRHANGLTAEQYHNVYGNDWSSIIYDGLRADFPEKRPLLLMRGGTAGLQRYSVFPWSTDVSRSWGGYKPQINIMLNSSLSGLGYMSSDLGGFAVDPEKPLDPELYLRWVQMGAFTPTFRTHAQLKPEPYNYPEYEDILKEIVKDRYRWLPYNYTLSYQNATIGAPLVRPLNFNGDNPGDRYANVQDEYLWGDNVLVAPVMNPGEVRRKVLFPAGKWYDWYNARKTYSGGTEPVVDAPLDRLPLFIKAGSFIPQYMQPIENVSQYDLRFLTVRYYPSSESTSYRMFDDNRLSPTSIEDEQYRLINFGGKDTKGTAAFSLQASGHYEGEPEVMLLDLVVMDFNAAPKMIMMSNGVEMKPYDSLDAISRNGYFYDKAAHTLTLRMTWDFKSLSFFVQR